MRGDPAQERSFSLAGLTQDSQVLDEQLFHECNYWQVLRSHPPRGVALAGGSGKPLRSGAFTRRCSQVLTLGVCLHKTSQWSQAAPLVMASFVASNGVLRCRPMSSMTCLMCINAQPVHRVYADEVSRNA